MNYYEHHIGDFDANTAHLTWIEDMAYTRLIRLYYRREKPIPESISEACRLVRAQSRDQKQAVESVLREFFELREDGWHQSRCDSEIAIYQKKVEHNQRVGKLGGRPRKTQTQSEPTENPPGYFREPEINPPQTPDPRHQSSKEVTHSNSGGSARDSENQNSGTEAGRVCKALKAAGIANVSPSHPELVAMIDKGVTVEMFAQAAETAVGKGKGFAYLLGVIKGQLSEASEIAAGPGVPQVPWDTNRQTIEAMGEKLGLGKWDEFAVVNREPFAAYTARVRLAVEGVPA